MKDGVESVSVVVNGITVYTLCLPFDKTMKQVDIKLMGGK